MLLLLGVMAPQQDDDDQWREFVGYVLHDR